MYLLINSLIGSLSTTSNISQIIKLGCTSIIACNVEGLKNCLADIDFLCFVNNVVVVFCGETWQGKSDSFQITCVSVPGKESIKRKRKSRSSNSNI